MAICVCMCVCFSVLHHLALRLDPVKREIYREREEDIVRTSISSSSRPPLHYLTQAIDPLHTHTRSHSSVCVFLSLLWIISSLFLLILCSSHLIVGECSKHLFEIIIHRTKCHNCRRRPLFDWLEQVGYASILTSQC